MKDVYVYEEAFALPNAREVLDKICWLGYNVHTFVDSVPAGNSKYVIDNRYPRWRGWKEVEVTFDEDHYKQLMAYRQAKLLDRVQYCKLDSDEQDECDH
jgi:hypothetical protein